MKRLFLKDINLKEAMPYLVKTGFILGLIAGAYLVYRR